MSRTWQGRRVLVTGGTAMTGSFLVESLLALGAAVRIPLRATGVRTPAARPGLEVLEGNLDDAGFCGDLVRDIDDVFHLASVRRNVALNHEQAGTISRANVTISVNLLCALESRPPVPVTFFSTANISAALDPVLLQAQDRIDGYVAGKYACELLWLAAARERRFPLLILRPVGIYGPRDTFSEEGNVIPSLIVKAGQGGECLPVWGSGRQERAFLYVEDVVGALLRLVNQDVQGVHYLAPPDTITVRALATKIRDLVHPALPLFLDDSRQEGTRLQPHHPVHACLADYPWTPLDDGLRRTVSWWSESRA